MALSRPEFLILDHTVRRAPGECCSGDTDEMQALVARGLMRSVGSISQSRAGLFAITEKGRDALRAWKWLGLNR